MTVIATTIPYPKLRPVEAHAITRAGHPALLLRDPLRLCDQNVVVPRTLAPVLALCDGTRDGAELCAELAASFGLHTEVDIVDELLAVLDAALLLDNAHSRDAQARALDTYRSAPFRPPALAGAVYPAGEHALRAMLDGYLDAEADVRPIRGGGRGLFSPHIDYARGGPVYARVWRRAAELVQDAELIVVFGTDHYADRGRITLTRQHYATPYGVLPTAQGAVDALAAAIGPEAAYAGELRHRDEHAIELVLVWLHHMRRGRPVPVIPILCGSFGHFVRGQADPAADPTFAALLAALGEVTAGQAVAVVVSGDLSHIGPAFGGEPVDAAGRARLRRTDDAVVDPLCAGDAHGFFDVIRAAGDRNNICGLPPGYLALRYLGGGLTGERIGYARCPADDLGTSIVSVGGVVWR